MSPPVRSEDELRVLILAPIGKDAALAQSVLGSAGIATYACRDLGELNAEASKGFGALIIAEEAVSQGALRPLLDLLTSQPAWSDPPVTILSLAGAEAEGLASLQQRLGNVTLLERPVRVVALVSSIQSALRARGRQYELRDRFEDRSLLASIVDSSDDAIISKNLKGVMTSWNAGAERLFGYRAEEAIGQPVTILISPDRLDEEEAILFRIRRGERVDHQETVRRRKDGTLIDVSLTVSPIMDASGKVIGASTIMRDVTDRKRAEAALKASEERLRSLVAVIADVTWTADADGAFVSPQAAWSESTGQSWDESRGFGWLHAIHPDDRERFAESWKRACLTRAASYETECRVWDGPFHEHRYVSVRATPRMNPDGSVREWIGAFTDVHERRIAEDALREADRKKNEFLATLAHELRNPLAPIRNSLQILDLSPTRDPNLGYVREVLDRQVHHMVRLVDDLMEVSRITRGNIELRRERVGLATLIRTAIETSQPLLEAGGHQLALELPGEPITIEADPIRIAQVFANLINNAAKYTEHASQIRVVVGREDDEAVIAVRDPGRGIPPDMLPHVFEMFTQVDSARERSQGGLGIGLTLVQNLVQLHGGTVTASSEGPGKGSEFVVRLPIAGGHPAPRSTPGRVPAALPGIRVLVVDDNVDAAESSGMLLELLGTETRVVHDGPAALDAMKSFAPDLVLLDLGMPGMDGFEVARRIRQMPEHQNVKLVALTGWGQAEDRRLSLMAGFDHHLVKPTEVEALRGLMQTVTPRPHGPVGSNGSRA